MGCHFVKLVRNGQWMTCFHPWIMADFRHILMIFKGMYQFWASINMGVSGKGGVGGGKS